MKKLPVLLVISLVGLTCFSGCGQSLEFGKVTGTVTHKGKPVEQILVTFYPDANSKGAVTKGKSSYAITDKDGKYVLEYAGPPKQTGAVVGTHRITVKDVAPEERDKGVRKQKLPYAVGLESPDSTTLRFDVKKGDNTFDIELTK